MGTEPHWVGRGKGILWPCTLRSSACSCLVTGLPGDSRLQPRSGDDGVREERVVVECLPDCSVEVALIFFPHSSASSLYTGRHPHQVLGTLEAPLTVSSVMCPHRLATVHSWLRLTAVPVVDGEAVTLPTFPWGEGLRILGPLAEAHLCLDHVSSSPGPTLTDLVAPMVTPISSRTYTI